MLVHKFCPILGSSYVRVEEFKQPLIAPLSNPINIALHAISVASNTLNRAIQIKRDQLKTQSENGK